MPSCLLTNLEAPPSCLRAIAYAPVEHPRFVTDRFQGCSSNPRKQKSSGSDAENLFSPRARSYAGGWVLQASLILN